MRSLLISPTDSRVVYLGTSDGQLFKSEDGGLSWSLLLPGLDRRQLVIDTLVEDPGGTGRLYAAGWDLRSDGGGLFESKDAGHTWNQVDLPGVNVAVRGFAISKGNPSCMIAGTGAGVFVSSDGGENWSRTGAKIEAFRQAESVAIDPRNPRLLFVGTWHLGYRSTDFGRTWWRNDSGFIADSDVFSISIDERKPGTMFASACTGLYRSVDHGASWTRLRVFPKSFLVRAQIVSIDPGNSARVYGGTTEGLFRSLDSGRSWQRITPSDWVVNAIQVDPEDSKVILIGTELHGVLRSDNGGKSWKDSNTGFVSRSITRVFADPTVPGRILAGERSGESVGGYYVFDNRADGWVDLDRNEIPGTGMLSLLVLPGSEGRIVGTAHGAFLQRPDTPGWTSLPGPISKVSVYDLTVDHRNEWIFAGTDDDVYRARLPELDFQKPQFYRFIPRVFSLLASRERPERLFAGTHLGVLRSEDSGATWSFATAGIPDHTIIENLAFAPGREDRIYAGTTAGLYVSRDGGNAWQRIPDDRLGTDIPAIIFLNASGARIMAAGGFSGGVFLSEDAGIHWDRIWNPGFRSPVRSLVQDPVNPSAFYLGTASEGVYRLFLQPSLSRNKPPQ